MLRDFQTASPDRYELLKAFARENRNNQTDAEKCLWQQLRSSELGVKFKRQHIIYDFIADFVCLEKMLIIEVDGAYHFTDSQTEYDIYRTEELERFGFRVLRFTNEEVIYKTQEVIRKIKESI
ncbi:MAG: endonuclease domain-containing protein [Bacteroidaceae bacterium]|jgi:very-short-patch-repair endonuclease|nr:endonuclease domain-containing protein [Bacteroidaceae bacterium]